MKKHNVVFPRNKLISLEKQIPFIDFCVNMNSILSCGKMR